MFLQVITLEGVCGETRTWAKQYKPPSSPCQTEWFPSLADRPWRQLDFWIQNTLYAQAKYTVCEINNRNLTDRSHLPEALGEGGERAPAWLIINARRAWASSPEMTRLSVSDLGQQALVLKRRWSLMSAMTGLRSQQIPPVTYPGLLPYPCPRWQSPSFAQTSLLGQARAQMTWPVTQFWPLRSMRKSLPGKPSWLLQRDTGRGMSLLLPLDIGIWKHELWSVTTLEPGGGLTTTEADRAREVERTRILMASRSHSINQFGSHRLSRSWRCETACLPGHLGKHPVTRSWKIRKTHWTLGPDVTSSQVYIMSVITDWIQNMFLFKDGSCCSTNKCKQCKGDYHHWDL